MAKCKKRVIESYSRLWLGVIAIAMLSLSHHRPTLPGRDPRT